MPQSGVAAGRKPDAAIVGAAMRHARDRVVQSRGEIGRALRYDGDYAAHDSALPCMSPQATVAVRKAVDSLFRPTFALPLDVFRVAFGILCVAYFLQLYREVPDFSAPDGLLDHALTREMFWYTRMGLFYPGISAAVLRATFLAASLASLALAAGYYPRAAALFMFFVAVSAYRRNFLVFFWDDGLMHLFMFWMVLLPIGTTLNLRDLRRGRRDAWQRWQHRAVPGAAVRCFAWNLALIYFVAGAWKLTSPMWLRGDALFVTLHTPAAYDPAFWSPAFEPFYRLGNYGTLVVELLSPLFLVLRPWHPVKWALLVLLLGFHLGIIATLGVPYSNIALLCAVVMLFRDEVMDALRAVPVEPRLETERAGRGFSGVFALVFITVLTAANTRFIPGLHGLSAARYDSVASGIDSRAVGGLSEFHMALYSALWLVGIAQEYQLFNWIDIRNYTVRYQVQLDASGVRKALDPKGLFPASTRSVILQAYLHDLTWFRIPAAYRDRLKESLSRRLANRYCRSFHPAGVVSVTSQLMRIRPDGSTTEPLTRTLMRFDCEASPTGILARMY
jgi:hypothetical protein